MRYCEVNRVGRSIVLIGMMGSGKSFIGRCLRRRTGLALLETDEMVTLNFGMSIPEIFSKHGEIKFREAETEALRAISKSKPAVIATGGGMVSRQENLKIFKRLGLIVWLDGNEETLFVRASRRTDRPLLKTKNPRKAFSQILDKRRPLYAKIADVRIDTSELTGEEAAIAVLSKFKRANRESPFVSGGKS
jgi:shikimate kinase